MPSKGTTWYLARLKKLKQSGYISLLAVDLEIHEG
jgi:hypothetical protein